MITLVKVNNIQQGYKTLLKRHTSKQVKELITKQVFMLVRIQNSQRA